jgi:uncharacterized membrane protein
MTVNMKCYYNSLRRDWEELKVSVMFVISLIVGGYIGSVFSHEIVTYLIVFLNNMFSSTISLIIVFIIMTLTLIFSVAGETRDRAKSQSCISNIVGLSIITVCSWMFVLLLYAMYISIFNISIPEQNKYLYEMFIGGFILLIVGIIVTPFALAYARCNNEPESDVEKSNMIGSPVEKDNENKNG